MPPSELDRMEMHLFNEYLKSIPKLRAAEQLTDIESLIYPKLKDGKDKSKITRRLEKDLRSGEEIDYQSPQEIARMLQNG